MRKIAIFLFCLLAGSRLSSLPIGNPAEPALFTEGIFWGGPYNDPGHPLYCWLDEWRIRVGYYGDFVFNRNLRISGHGLGQSKVIRETHLKTNAAYMAFNVCDLFDLFATAGTTSFRFKTRESSWNINGRADGTLFTDNRFSWSAGGRVHLLTWKCFSLGLEGQYFRCRPRFTKYISAFEGLYNYFNRNNTVTYSEWQIGGGLSYTLRTDCPRMSVIPYVGAKWSRAHLNTRNFEFNKLGDVTTLRIFDLTSNKRWGYAVGSTFTFCERIGFTAEGRFGDERALFINGEICF